MRSSQGQLVRSLDGAQEWAMEVAGKVTANHFYRLELRTNADTYQQHFALLKDGEMVRTFEMIDRVAAFAAVEEPEAIAQPQEYKVVVMVSIQGFREETVTAWSRTEAEKLAADRALTEMQAKVWENESIEGLRALRSKGVDGKLAVSANPGTAQEIKS